MRRPQIALCVGLLIALVPASLTEQETQQQQLVQQQQPLQQQQQQQQQQRQSPAVTGPEDAEQCASCEVRQHMKTMRLNAIRSQILSKLRMKEAPNISRDMVKQLLPKAPPLQQLLDQYDVLGDDSRDGLVEEDEEHATAETIMMMATERECIFKVTLGKYSNVPVFTTA